MKDSGIEWIGEIPEEWEVTEISGLYCARNTKVNDVDYPPLSVTKQGVLPQLENVAKSDDHDNRKLVKKGDFVINSRSDRRGACGISKYDGSVSLINIVLQPLKKSCNSYYNWLFNTIQFSEEFYKWGHGIVDDLWTTTWQDMKKISVPMPPVYFQQHIANYLDKKCSKIDSLADDIQKQIGILEQYRKSVITEAVTKGLDPNVKMKDSGIEWIGEIPEEWEIIKIKNIAFLKGRIGWQGLESKEYQEEGAFLITGTDFEDGTINWDNCVHISEQRYYEDKLLHIKENDLLITKDGTIGKIAIVKNCPEQATLNSGVMYIRGNSAYRYLTKYLYYVLMSEEFWEWYNASQRGNSTIKHLYQEQFYNFIFSYPSLFEQQQIALSLDSKCSKLDKLISLKNQQLETLMQYKKSLIYECVTGKREVI